MALYDIIVQDDVKLMVDISWERSLAEFVHVRVFYHWNTELLSAEQLKAPVTCEVSNLQDTFQ